MSDKQTLPHARSVVPVRTLRVEVVQGPDKGQSKTTTSDTIAIGSAPQNDLVLSDETVSRFHLELHHLGSRIMARDLGSTNGTASGTVWIERATVAPGTVLELGKTSIRVDDGDTVSLEVHDDDRLGRVRGRSSEMRKLMAQISRAAKSDVSVLLLGETGVGKEVIANAIHEESPRAEMPFETVDCGALSPNLIASELFGHEKGAFTGADQQHVGAFERADGGTLFLDEIGELPPALQTSLLGALERRNFRRVGGKKTIDVNVRVVCATHQDLRSAVNAGTFRQDLYYRIAVVLLQIPPLRERTDDIPLLAEHFLREAGFSGDVREVIPANAMDALLRHRWPGNLRELRNFVEAALAMGEPPNLAIHSVEGEASSGDSPTFPSVALPALVRSPYKDARGLVLDEFEAYYLEKLLERCAFNVSRAARESGISRAYLSEMLKRHRLRGKDRLVDDP